LLCYGIHQSTIDIFPFGVSCFRVFLLFIVHTAVLALTFCSRYFLSSSTGRGTQTGSSSLAAVIPWSCQKVSIATNSPYWLRNKTILTLVAPPNIRCPSAPSCSMRPLQSKWTPRPLDLLSLVIASILQMAPVSPRPGIRSLCPTCYIAVAVLMVVSPPVATRGRTLMVAWPPTSPL
jgi:hypothetical protein